MRKLLAINVMLAFVTLNVKGGELIAPFEIPPHNQPELLLGDIKFDAPTAMAFDSQNRPYLLNNRNPASFGKLQTIREGKWVTRSMLESLRQIAIHIPRQTRGQPGARVG